MFMSCNGEIYGKESVSVLSSVAFPLEFGSHSQREGLSQWYNIPSYLDFKIQQIYTVILVKKIMVTSKN